MKVNIYALPQSPNWTYTEVQYLYYRYIRKYAPKGVEIVLKNRLEEQKLVGIGYCPFNGCKFGPFYVIIENDETKKFILVSYWDNASDIFHHLSDDIPRRLHTDSQNCVEIITSSGVHSPLFQGIPYTPFTFVAYSLYVERQIEKMYRSNVVKAIPDKLKFKGLIYDFREHMSLDDRFDVRNKDTFEEQYIEELATERISLGLHGAGDTSTRDMETLGLGNVMVRKKFHAKFHNPLISDVHYAGVEWEDIAYSDNPHKTFEGGQYFWKELANRYYDKFQQIKNDEEYLNYVSQNARKWYLENGTVKANVRLMCKLVDFNKLI